VNIKGTEEIIVTAIPGADNEAALFEAQDLSQNLHVIVHLRLKGDTYTILPTREYWIH
jgi:hypothetical protein